MHCETETSGKLAVLSQTAEVGLVRPECVLIHPCFALILGHFGTSERQQLVG